MASTYSIKIDADKKIVTAKLAGFFSPQEVAEFARDEQAAARSLGCRSGEFGLLICTHGGQAQAQDVIGAFQGLMHDLPLKAGRIAFVSESALLNLQLRRMIPADRARVFGDVEEATKWVAQGLAFNAAGSADSVDRDRKSF